MSRKEEWLPQGGPAGPKTSPLLLPVGPSCHVRGDLNKCNFKAKPSLRGACWEWSSLRNLAVVAEELPSRQTTMPH